MLLSWIKAQDAVDAGAALADSFPEHTTGDLVRDFLHNATEELRTRKLSFYKRVRFANAFKWRLLEKGVTVETAHDVTQTLLINMSSLGPAAAAAPAEPATTAAIQLPRPKDSAGFNNLGVTLCELGRYDEAKRALRSAISRDPKNVDALTNIGSLHLAQGRYADAENFLRRAAALEQTDPRIRTLLGETLILQSLVEKGRTEFDKVLKASPRFAPALTGSGNAERAAGRFVEAEQFYRRALEIDTTQIGAWIGIAHSRRMTPADSKWVAQAEQVAADIKSVPDRANLHFAVGKCFDDLGEYSQAFDNYKRANELLKPLAQPYDEREHSRFVNDMACTYTPDTIKSAKANGSSSTRPVFVVGMPRSGTSLVEQILASHPSVAGVGELEFWNEVVRADEARIRNELLPQDRRAKIAADYLEVLKGRQPDAGYVVDKAPRNADYLGLIHSVFPDARILYVRRDPIDTCLSCYFQNFALGLNFKFDLTDLAGYYRQHARLMAHWRKVLPAGTMLDVPYEELVADQEPWTRKILAHLGLEWDVRCLKFNENPRTVVTASSWQVRQRMYGDSVERWRHYSKYIEPLRKLEPF